MIEVVDTMVRGNTFSERYDTQRIPIKCGDYCLLESPIGIQMGKIVSDPRVMKARCVDKKLPKIIRRASDNDLDMLTRIEELERDAARFCQSRIAEIGLEMKLVKVLFAFDRSKGLFMFTADGRVDFRELVRDLAQNFKTRIEMRQIGIRDEARLLGGIGNCGNPLCCVTFLRDFHPVSIKMAKDQGLSLIPSKISGICGRLMCCLQYEHKYYAEQVKSMPKIGKRVMTPKGEGRIRQLNILKGLILVDLVEGEMEEFSAEDVIPLQKYLEEKEARAGAADGGSGTTDRDADTPGNDRESTASAVQEPEQSNDAPDRASSRKNADKKNVRNRRRSPRRGRRSGRNPRPDRKSDGDG